MTNPYEAPNADLVSANNHYRYVGFWPRVGASIIDSLVMMPVIVGLLFVIYGSGYFTDTEAQSSGLALLIHYLLPVIFVVGFWIYRNATPGKIVLGAVIVDAKSGKPPSKGQYVIRYLGYLVSSIVLMLGLIWVAFDSRKQGWHDKMAGTLVVYR